jgi:tRNA U34 5-carboxymethylaminomethyl modifying enzyme MnmG/GidA
MDQRESYIKTNIDETRGAMGEKIDLIVNRIHNTIVGPKVAADNLIQNLTEYRRAMQETTSGTNNGANAIHQAVAETIERVKATINIIEQVKQDPWIMLAAAVVMGYVIGNLNRGDLFALRHAHREVGQSRELQSPQHRQPSSEPPEPGRRLSASYSHDQRH